MTTEDPTLRRGINEAAAEFLRSMANLVESDDSALVEFRRETEHLWLLPGQRAAESPLRETWVIKLDIQRETRGTTNAGSDPGR